MKIRVRTLPSNPLQWIQRIHRREQRPMRAFAYIGLTMLGFSFMAAPFVFTVALTANRVLNLGYPRATNSALFQDETCDSMAFHDFGLAAGTALVAAVLIWASISRWRAIA